MNQTLQKENLNAFKKAFINAINFHRKLSVAAVWDLAVEVAPEASVKDVNDVVTILTDKNLVSFSRTHEFFYLGNLKDHTSGLQEPMPAEALEKLISEVNTLRKEVREK